MKKGLTYAKYGLAMLLMAFVAYNFYVSNLYYATATLVWKTLGFNMVLIGAAATSIFFIGQKKLEIKLKWLILMVFLSAMFIGVYQFVDADFSRVTGGSLVKEGTVISLIEDREDITENMEVLFEEDELVRSTRFITENIPEAYREVFLRAPFFKSMGTFALKLLYTLGGALLFYIIFTGVGQAIMYRKEEKLNPEHRIISFFGGAFFFSVAVFLLTAFGVYTVSSLLVALALALLISWRQIWSSILFLFSYKISFQKKRKEVITVMGFFTVFLAMAMIDSIRVFPIAWDDINLYARAAKFMATDNIFPLGIGPTAWTNLQSIPWLFVDIMQGSNALLFAVLAIGIASFFLLSRKFLNLSSAVWGSMFFALIPMLTFFYVIDTKIEIPLLATGIASLLAWMNWKESKKKRDLLIMAALLGFTLTIKITALLLVMTVLLMTLYEESKRKYLVAALFFLAMSYFAWSGQLATLRAFSLSHAPFAYVFTALTLSFTAISIWKEKPFTKLKQYKSPLIVLGILALFMLPWMIFNYVETGTLSISALIFGEKDIVRFDPELIKSASKQAAYAFFADYKRYAGPGAGLLGLLLFPWNSIMTPELDTFISDITFMFLAIIPLWLLFPGKIFKKQKALQGMLIFTTAYVFMWMLLSSGVSWYGIFMLIPGTILVFHTMQQKELWWRIPLALFLILSMASSFLLRNHMFAEQRMFAYSLGLYTEEALLDDFYPGFGDVRDAFLEYEKNGEKAVVYRVGSQAKYFLPMPDARIMDDDFLDDFSQISEGKSTDDIKEIYVDTGVTHILFHRGVELSQDNSYYESYALRRQEFEQFLIDSNWPILLSDFDIILIEVQDNEND